MSAIDKEEILVLMTSDKAPDERAVVKSVYMKAS